MSDRLLVGLAPLNHDLLDKAAAVFSQMAGVSYYPTVMSFHDDIPDQSVAVVVCLSAFDAEQIRDEGGVVVHVCNHHNDLLCSVLPVAVKNNDFVISSHPHCDLHHRVMGLLTTIREERRDTLTEGVNEKSVAKP